MRFVPTKTVEQQSCLMLHRARHLFIRQQTAAINSIRAYLAEFGIVTPVGRRGVEQLLEVVDRRGSQARNLLPGPEGALSWPTWPVGLFRSQAVSPELFTVGCKLPDSPRRMSTEIAHREGWSGCMRRRDFIKLVGGLPQDDSLSQGSYCALSKTAL
jgi:hypothetical protein